MSAAIPTATAAVGRTFLGELIPEYIGLATFPVIAKGIQSAFRFIMSMFSDTAKEAVVARVKKTFEEIRNEVYEYIQVEVRGNDAAAADGLIQHLHRRKKPLQEYRTWAVLMGLYKSLQEPKEETGRLEVFKRLGRMSDDEFDKAVNDLTHDPVKQFFDWLKALPLWKRIKLFWRLADAKVRMAAVLIVGLPIWGIFAMLLYGSLNNWWAKAAAIVAVVCLIGYGVAHTMARPKKRRTAKSRTVFWKSVFGWGAFALLPLILLLGFASVTSVFWIPYLIAAGIDICFLAGIFWLVFGKSPLAALGLHLAGELEGFGLLQTVLKGFWAMVAWDAAILFCLPLAHSEQHPVGSVFFILAFGIFLAAWYSEQGFIQLLAAGYMVGFFIYGFVMNPVEQKRFAPAMNAVSEFFAATSAKATTMTAKQPASATAAPQQVSEKRHNRSEEPAASKPADNRPAETVRETPYANYNNAWRESPVTTIVGEVVACEAGDLPQNHPYGGDLCVDDGRGVARFSYNFTTPLYYQGKKYGPGNLEAGDQVSVRALGANMRSGQLLRDVRDSNNWR